MTAEQQYFISLSKAAVFGETPPAPPPELDWKWMLDKSVEQNITGLLASAIDRLSDKQKPANYRQWHLLMLQTAMIMSRKADEFERMAKVLAQNGIEFITLKGMAVKSLYGRDRELLRTMGDFDVFVEKESTKSIKRLFEANGYRVQTERVGLIARKENFLWDIFVTLEEEFGEYAEKYDMEIRRTEIKKDSLPQPHPTYMLAHMILHFSKHIITEGAGIRSLLDIALYIKNYSENIEYEKVVQICWEVRFEKVYIYVLNVLNKYFGFHLSVNDREPEKFIELLLDGGVFGEGHSNLLLSQVSKGGEEVGVFRKLFFPPRFMLEPSYKYLKGRPYLLPIAWVHRFLYAVFHRKYSLRKMCADINGSVEFEKRHNKMMKEAGLYEER